jgi:hypothetical protein
VQGNMMSAKQSIGGKLSLVPGINRQTLGPQNAQQRNAGIPLLSQMEFSKPEHYIREIMDFLNQVTIATDIFT